MKIRETMNICVIVFDKEPAMLIPSIPNIPNFCKVNIIKIDIIVPERESIVDGVKIVEERSPPINDFDSPSKILEKRPNSIIV